MLKVSVVLGLADSSDTNKSSASQSQENDPFSRNDGNNDSQAPSDGQNDQGSSNGRTFSEEDLWKTFEEFFNQHQR